MAAATTLDSSQSPCSHSGSAIVLPTMLAVSCSIIVQLKCEYMHLNQIENLHILVYKNIQVIDIQIMAMQK
jgi:hypothetical protein